MQKERDIVRTPLKKKKICLEGKYFIEEIFPNEING